MLRPEEIRVEIKKLWEERHEENVKYKKVMKDIDRRIETLREQCPHENTRNWFEYESHGKVCSDCGKEIY